MLLKLAQFENPKFNHLIPNYCFEMNRNLNLGLKKKNSTSLCLMQNLNVSLRTFYLGY